MAIVDVNGLRAEVGWLGLSVQAPGTAWLSLLRLPTWYAPHVCTLQANCVHFEATIAVMIDVVVITG